MMNTTEYIMSLMSKTILSCLLAIQAGVISASTSAELPTHQAQANKVAQYSLNESGELSIKEMESNAPTREAYRIREGDKLKFVLVNDKIDVEVIVDNLGSINLEYINWVEVKGKTLDEATNTITALYEKDFFVNPNLKLRLIEKAPIRYKILGQVANPGFYEVPPGLEIDLLDAIAIAGGYTRIAGKITFKSKTSGRSPSIQNYKIKELTKATEDRIPGLKGGETIIVGESFF